MADRNRYALASQLAILRNCPEVLSRLLRKGGSVLLAAKILVISRLLHKKLSEHPGSFAYIEGIRARLVRLRQRLLVGIDRRLKSPGIDTGSLVDAMCAYSLAKSSSATDVLRHFHKLRIETISNPPANQDGSDAGILQSLQLWIRTIRETQLIFPKQLNNALAILKSVPLLRGDDMRSIVEFDYDIHEAWIGEEIKKFTPYIRHDDLQNPAAARDLSSWAPKALSTFLAIIKNRLSSLGDMNTIIQLRQECLESWFVNRSSATGIDKAEVLETLRNVFSERLLSVIRDRCASLSTITSFIEMALQHWDPAQSDEPLSLWDSHMVSMDTSHGAKSFKEALTTRLLGRNDFIRNTLQRYRSWLDSIEEAEKAIRSIENTKWDDTIEDGDDEDDLGDTAHSLLNEDDPRALIAELGETLKKAFALMETSIGTLVERSKEEPDSGSRSAFLARILREIRQTFPKAYRGDGFALEFIPTLHKAVSTALVEFLMTSQQGAIARATTRSNVPGRALWDGDPELPILPSPWAFKFLRALQQAMAGQGSDIWSPKAVAELKTLLRASLDEIIRPLEVQKARTRKHDSHSQGEDPAAPAALTPWHEHRTQQLFDLAYLGAATAAADLATEDGFDGLQELLERQVALSAELVERVRAAAGEYWKRTALLFALLA
jgi:hypothetical protein